MTYLSGREEMHGLIWQKGVNDSEVSMGVRRGSARINFNCGCFKYDLPVKKRGNARVNLTVQW
jgi:hypothetical protein